MRKGSVTARNFALAGLILNMGKMLAKYAGATYTEELQQAKLEKIQKDIQVAEMRREKLHNELVIQDLEIAKRKKKLGIPDDDMDWRPVDL